MAIRLGRAERGSCARIRRWLPYYDVGGLDPWRRWRVGRHLARCRECSAELAALWQATALLEHLPEEAAPAGMWERLEDALDAAQRQAVRRAGPARRLIPAAATVLVVTFAGLAAWHQGRVETPRPPTAAYVRSHLALSQSSPFAPAAGLDALVAHNAPRPVSGQ